MRRIGGFLGSSNENDSHVQKGHHNNRNNQELSLYYMTLNKKRDHKISITVAYVYINLILTLLLQFSLISLHLNLFCKGMHYMKF